MARNSHEQLFNLLFNAESSRRTVTQDEIISRTGWKESTFLTYLNKGQLSFLTPVDEDKYQVSGVSKFTVTTFSKHLSQSKHRRELGHNCSSSLSKALLRKARENMMLALELYNRPSLENRLDAFVLIFCTAWEQLLKAMLIEKDSEDSIFDDSNKKGRARDSISLRTCLERVYKEADPIRRNIEKIKYYRDKATHLLMPEVQSLVSRVFQSGVINFSEEFERFTEHSLIGNGQGGLMSLVGDFQEPNVLRLKNAYGKTIGNEIFDLAKTLEKEIDEIGSINYAIPMDIKLVFAKDDGSGKYIAVSRAEEGMKALKDAVIIEKPVDRSKTHPYKATDAESEINKRLHFVLSPESLETKLVARDKGTKLPKFGRDCFLAAVEHYRWKDNNNKFHYNNTDPVLHYYSEYAVDEIVKKIAKDDGFVARIKKSKTRKHPQ